MTVAIVGIGLIGGSLALDLKANGFADVVIGVDKNQKHVLLAKQFKLVDEICDLETAIKKSKLIILSIPVGEIVKILPNILSLCTDNQVVTDMGSTKFKIVESITNHKNRNKFVASHPMAGTEFSGPKAAINNLFANKAAIICDKANSEISALKLVEKMYKSLFMKLIYMDSKSHDIHAAYVSHISHISSFLLANTVLEKENDEAKIFDLASGGFESTVRLAKSSPKMWADIFVQNRANIKEVLETYIKQLQNFKNAIAENNYSYIFDEMEKANEIKRILK